MTCPRCSGLIIKEYMTAHAEYDRMKPCLKCINCGYYDDLIFSLNRRQQYVSERVIMNGRV